MHRVEVGDAIGGAALSGWHTVVALDRSNRWGDPIAECGDDWSMTVEAGELPDHLIRKVQS